MAPTILAAASRILSRSSAPNLRRDDSSKANFGQGTTGYESFNNNAFLILFGLIGAGMVLASIWFFFWAKNGGFKWRKGDWDDYKSTVLRRKGPDGRTLSNATKSTKLGGGSVVHNQTDYTSSVGYTDSSYTDGNRAEKGEIREKSGGGWFRGGGGPDREQREKQQTREKRRSKDPERERRHRERREQRRSRDPELASYRHERAARVGGMNREADGSHWDYTNTDRSELSSTAPLAKPSTDKSKTNKDKKGKDKESKAEKKERKEKARREKQAAKDAASLAKRAAKAEKEHNAAVQKEKRKAGKHPSKHHDQVTETATSYMGENRTVYTGTYTDATPYSEDYTSHSGTHTQTQSSYYNAYRPRATINTVREDDERSDPGTKVYRHQHHVPGLKAHDEVGVEDSISQVGGRVYEANQRKKGYDRMAGFRRGKGRRGSLSDSDDN